VALSPAAVITFPAPATSNAAGDFLAKQLEREGFEVGRLHVTTLMRRMGIEALYRRPRTSIPARDAKIYPYLLDGLAIERSNQVWASDLTYVPMAHGFLYLVAILDVASRKVLSFRVSNTMTPDFCVDALTEAIARYGAPEIVNTDQGSQFTSKAWTDVVEAAGARISMDGKGRWIDNVFIERLWRSVKYEDIYLRAYENGRQLQAGLTRYFDFYNRRRAFGGECRLIDCDTAVNDHTLDPLANVNMPDDSVGSRAKNHASMIFQITPRARSAA
jgi:putative transposase